MRTWRKTWHRSQRLVYALCGLLFFQTMLVTLGVHYDHHESPAVEAGAMTLDLASLQGSSSDVGCDAADHCCHSQLPVFAVPHAPGLHPVANTAPLSVLDSQTIPFPSVSGLFRPPIV